MFAMLFGITLGFFMMFWLLTASELLTALFTNSFVRTFRLFNKMGTRHTADEKMNWHRDRFTMVPLLMLGHDFDSFSEAEMKRVTGISITIFGLFSAIYSFLILFFMWGDQRLICRTLRLSAVYVIASFITILIKTLASEIGSKNSLALFCRTKIRELRAGASFDQLDVRVSDQVRKKSNRNSRCLYLDICGMKALWTKDFNSLNSIVREQDQNLRKKGPSTDFVYDTMLMGGYYMILFYSTYVNQNYNNAVKIYNFIRPALEADMDPNGRRVLAYYQFYIMKQPDLAAITLNQAVTAVQDYNRSLFTDAEINLEKRLIEELQNNMTNVMNPGTFTRPVIENTLDDTPVGF